MNNASMVDTCVVDVLLVVDVVSLHDSLAFRSGKGIFNEIPLPEDEVMNQQLCNKVASFIEALSVDVLDRLGEYKVRTLNDNRAKVISDLKGILYLLIQKKALTKAPREHSVVKKGNLMVTFTLSDVTKDHVVERSVSYF